MKLLIFAFIIASILEDYGTFEQTPVHRCTDVKLLELFKKTVLELVTAVIKPLIGHDELLEGGCECLAGVDVYQYVNHVDAVLATMSIAKDHQRELALIDETDESKLSGITSKISERMLDNVRQILIVLQASHLPNDPRADDRVYRKYLLKHGQGSATAAAEASGLKCFQTLYGLYNNDEFVVKVLSGIELFNQLMPCDNNKRNRDARWGKVDELIEGIPACQLQTYAPKSTEEFDEFLKWLKERAKHGRSAVR